MKLDRVRSLRETLPWKSDHTSAAEPLAGLRAAAAQLMLATAATATLEHTSSADDHQGSASARSSNSPLAWAPALIGPLAALAHLEHTRRPSRRTATALRLLGSASVAVGGVLFALDLAHDSDHRPKRLGSLAFASAGLLAVLLEREERGLDETERELRRRADIVERLVPKRKARLDRVVVHV